ncbi:hypothetical protein FB446DRAFT_390679 [Lentinula raphanica]|nr:hypothetical protein FB446DRAFT_390679 [Lentinula raphanica]
MSDQPRPYTRTHTRSISFTMPAMPTLTLPSLPTFLRKPSRKYTFPKEDKKEYYSAKASMFDVALIAKAGENIEKAGTGDMRVGEKSGNGVLLNMAGDRKEEEVDGDGDAEDDGEEVIHDDEESEDEEEEEVFYTPSPSPSPPHSPRSPMHTNIETTLPSRPSLPSRSTTTTSTTTTATTTTMTTIRSSATATTARLTTTNTARNTRKTKRNSNSWSSSRSSSSSTSASSLFDEHISAGGSTEMTSVDAHESRGYLDSQEEDWAKDVRWLVPPPPPSSSSSSSLPPPNPHPTQRRPQSRNRHRTRTRTKGSRSSRNSYQQQPRRRMSALVEDEHENSEDGYERERVPRERRGVYTPYTPHTSYTTSSSSSRAVTPGFPSLSIPRAPPPAINPIVKLKSKKKKTEGLSSLMGQTTMASVEVTSGIVARRTRFWRRGDEKEREIRLSLMSYRGVPSEGSLGSQNVLVEVWSVALDQTDVHLVQNTKVGKVGFIPGRSFLGRIVECGSEIEPDDLKKGEWVIGLLDPAKSGGLTQYVVLNRRRVCGVPHPNRSLSLTKDEYAFLPLCGIPAYRAVRAIVRGVSLSSHPSPSSFPLSSSPSSPSSPSHPFSPSFLSPPSSSSSSRPRVLVLCGHVGPGALAVQMLVRLGWNVCVHVPPVPLVPEEREEEYIARLSSRIRAWGADDVIFDDGGVGYSPSSSLSSSSSASASSSSCTPFSHSNVDDTDADPNTNTVADADADANHSTSTSMPTSALLRAIDRLRTDGDVFDAVLDTVGGKDVWEASRGLLSQTRMDSTCTIDDADDAQVQIHEKQFVTLLGDTPSNPLPSVRDHWRAGVRSTYTYTHTHSSSHSSHSSSLPPSSSPRPSFSHSSSSPRPSSSLPRSSSSSSQSKSSPAKTPRSSSSSNPSSKISKKTKIKINYAWISLGQDVDWEGEDVAGTLGEVVRVVLTRGHEGERGIRPWVGEHDGEDTEDGGRIVPFERAPELFNSQRYRDRDRDRGGDRDRDSRRKDGRIEEARSGSGLFENGETAVVRVVG